MTRAAQPRLARLRALCAALFLLVAAVSAPIALSTQTADVCGMACCVKEGHCCCSPTHAYVEGQIPDDNPHIADRELWASCPDACATAGRFSNLLFRDHLRGCAPQPLDEQPRAFFLARIVAARDLVEYGSSAPRAPPTSSIF